MNVGLAPASPQIVLWFHCTYLFACTQYIYGDVPRADSTIGPLRLVQTEGLFTKDDRHAQTCSASQLYFNLPRFSWTNHDSIQVFFPLWWKLDSHYCVCSKNEHKHCKRATMDVATHFAVLHTLWLQIYGGRALELIVHNNKLARAAAHSRHSGHSGHSGHPRYCGHRRQLRQHSNSEDL